MEIIKFKKRRFKKNTWIYPINFILLECNIIIKFKPKFQVETGILDKKV